MFPPLCCDLPPWSDNVRKVTDLCSEPQRCLDTVAVGGMVEFEFILHGSIIILEYGNIKPHIPYRAVIRYNDAPEVAVRTITDPPPCLTAGSRDCGLNAPIGSLET